MLCATLEARLDQRDTPDIEEDGRAMEGPSAAAQDAVVRLALGMWAADVRATITPLQREWVITRLQPPAPPAPWRPFTAQEKARLAAPLLAYITTYHPRVLGIVQAQFAGGETA